MIKNSTTAVVNLVNLNLSPAYKDIFVRAIAFNDEDIISRIKDETGFGAELFEDLKLFLILARFRQLDFAHNHSPKPSLSIDDDLYILDQAWHTFLLFTEDYQLFCTQNLGSFIHHIPIRQSERSFEFAQWLKDKNQWEQKKKDAFKEELFWLSRYLHPDKIKEWFIDKKWRKIS